ncbi:MarR family winged helix-turn-helix transcriptional regulator [Mangrovicoccus sp. HB161399]|uniref:MarR family winged helix-turn-helix transcriptional regulator n=1 Tax=Mangrovicoccus sp. HB161399 TaxID=2720392 RepID=UPI001556D1AB|nr:MarR family winged helix-turn-helix transcriptional regulator [Mangrovicoccus sp. HB161399]
MDRARITGPGAGVWKYDILTALTLWGLNGSQGEQATAMRLIAMVTARYNWQRDEVSIGQRDLARLWGVTDRTVKRELKRLAAIGLIETLRPGVRGRVASYRLVPEAVAAVSAPYWDRVGPDFAERIGARQAAAVKQEGPQVLRVDFRQMRGTPEPESGDPWSQVQSRLRAAAPEAYGAWFAGLSLRDATADRIEIAAQSAFVLRYIETHFGELLRSAVAEAFGPGPELALSCGG